MLIDKLVEATGSVFVTSRYGAPGSREVLRAEAGTLFIRIFQTRK